MLSFKEKIKCFDEQLTEKSDNYADSFKMDIFFFIDDFETTNPKLFFLKDLSSKKEISGWINKLTSRIVMKFDEESESINDFIDDYLENG